MKIGLCLSGGGVRGAFHIGVIKALEELQIKPSIVAGTSAGALVGSLYCSGMNSAELLNIAKSTKWYHFIGPHLPNTGLTEMNFLLNLLKTNILIDDYASLKIPLISTAANLVSGLIEYFDKGKLFETILASCAVPVLFKPQSINGTKYLDGGILVNLPTRILKNKCEFIIGSNLLPHHSIEDKDITNLTSVVSRVMEMSIHNSMKSEYHLADILIEDNSINQFSRFNLNNAIELYELGYQAAMRILTEKMNTY